MRPSPLIFLLAIAMPSVATATGDIYVGTDAFGNVFFTDTPPTYAGFTTFLKQPSRSGSTWTQFSKNFTVYDDLIQGHAQKNGLEAALVKAVVFAESAFNPDAVSRAGAQGLMQIMPHVQPGLGVSDAFDPEQSIGGGTRLLAQLMRRYDSNLRLAVAAYNAGPSAVDKYGGVPPYSETRNYVEKVEALANHFRANGLATRP